MGPQQFTNNASIRLPRSEAWAVACDWLASLRTPSQPSTQRDPKKRDGFNLAGALRWASTADALRDDGRTTVLLIACSKPEDLDACIGLARRSNVSLHMVGVFGLSPEDPA